jgi:hypothetical protein
MLALRRGIGVLLLLLLPLAACAGSRGADHGGHGSGTTPAVGSDVEFIASRRPMPHRSGPAWPSP